MSGETHDRGELLRAYLADRDVPCPMCEYNLRDLPGDRCPECGERFRLQVGLTDPKLAGFIFGLVGITVGFGFSSLMLVGAGISFLFVGSPTLEDVYPLIVISVIESIALYMWIRCSSSIRRWTVRKRWTVAGLCWLMSLGGAVWFFSFVV